MKHRVVGRRLDRTTEHRTAMFRNMVTSLLRHERIETTTPKAKELKRIADKIITLAKRGSPHHRRIANRDVRDVEVLNKLFGPIAQRFAARPGGYTRLVRVGRRVGDNAEMSVIELLDRSGGAAAEGDGAPAEKGAKAAKPAKEAKATKAKAEKRRRPRRRRSPRRRPRPRRRRPRSSRGPPGPTHGSGHRSAPCGASTAAVSVARRGRDGALACEPRALPLVALAVLAWLEDRVTGVAQAAPPLALALVGAWGLGAVGFPGAPLAGAGALAAFALAAYGRRAIATGLLLAGCAAGQVVSGEGRAELAAGAAAGAALGIAVWVAAVRLRPEGHLARRRRARVDSRAKLA